nr:hypothetical protein GCM10020093_112330 [Planobispora longispora]
MTIHRQGIVSATLSTDDKMRVLVYSDDASTREKVRQAIGRRPAADVPLVEIVECATHAKVVQHFDSGEIDVAVLDAEAQPPVAWAWPGRPRTRSTTARPSAC